MWYEVWIQVKKNFLYEYPFVQASFAEKIIFLHWILLLHLCGKISWFFICVILFLDSIPSRSFLCMPTPHCLGYWIFVISFDSGRISLLILLFFKVVLVILGTLHSCMNFRMYVNSYKKAYWDFDWDCVIFVEQFGENAILI